MENLIGYLGTLLGGGILWELIKYFSPEIRQKIQSYYDAKNGLYQNLDPIIKSADELFGKLESLALNDFLLFRKARQLTPELTHSRTYVYYLFAQFWANLEFIRMKSQYFSMSRFAKGRELIQFIETIESKKFRILDRSIQRIIGEILISHAVGPNKIMTFNQFILALDNQDPSLGKWITVLEKEMDNLNDLKIRQKLLVFGIVVLSFINHFDPKHQIVRRRRYYTNKLNQKSIFKLRYSLFTKHLPFVKRSRQYWE